MAPNRPPQGPCESNQAALAATSFLAVCNRIFDNMRYTEEATEKAEKMLAHRRAMHYKCAIKTSVLNLLIRCGVACVHELRHTYGLRTLPEHWHCARKERQY